MTMKIVFLLAQSARSVAYVQAASKANIEVSNAIVYGNTSFSVTSTRQLYDATTHLFCPDLSLDLPQSLAMTEWPVWQCDSKSLDNEALLAKLNALSPDLIVFSGYGGQIVPKVLLNIAPMLHIHSGLLPEFPGSTTIYYQILEHQRCGASAILLDETIDTGPVLARKSYPIPAHSMDIDYLYDTMIRADLLVDVLRDIEDYPLIKAPKIASSQAAPYFIIHPLLKHIAILSADKQSAKQGSKID
jgi:methionyl-tRNA formyltransferase